LLNETDLASVVESIDALASIADQDRRLFDEVKSYLDASRASKELLEEQQAEQAADMERLLALEDQAATKRSTSIAGIRGLKKQIATLQADIRKADAAAAKGGGRGSGPGHRAEGLAGRQA